MGGRDGCSSIQKKTEVMGACALSPPTLLAPDMSLSMRDTAASLPTTAFCRRWECRELGLFPLHGCCRSPGCSGR